MSDSGIYLAGSGGPWGLDVRVYNFLEENTGVTWRKNWEESPSGGFNELDSSFKDFSSFDYGVGYCKGAYTLLEDAAEEGSWEKIVALDPPTGLTIEGEEVQCIEYPGCATVVRPVNWMALDPLQPFFTPYSPGKGGSYDLVLLRDSDHDFTGAWERVEEVLEDAF